MSDHIMTVTVPTPTGSIREEIFDRDGQRILGRISSPDGGVSWAAYALTPVTEEHRFGRHVVPWVKSRQEAIEAVVMMHRYWTLPARGEKR